MPEETSTASVSGEGGWFSGSLCPLPVRGKAFFSLSHPNPLLVLPKYCSHNLRKLKGKNKGFDRVFLPNRLLHSPKPAGRNYLLPVTARCGRVKPPCFSPSFPETTPLISSLVWPPWPLLQSVHAQHVPDLCHPKILGGTLQGHLKYRMNT